MVRISRGPVPIAMTVAFALLLSLVAPAVAAGGDRQRGPAESICGG
jgi:hypothetical protein